MKQKLPRGERGRTLVSFGREDPIVGIPSVVVALPGVDVPLAVVGVPVDVDDAGALVSAAISATAHRNILRAVSNPGHQSPPAADTN